MRYRRTRSVAGKMSTGKFWVGHITFFSCSPSSLCYILSNLPGDVGGGYGREGNWLLKYLKVSPEIVENDDNLFGSQYFQNFSRLSLGKPNRCIENSVKHLRLKSVTAQKMKFSNKDFRTKCDPFRSFLRIWSHLQKKSFIEDFIFCEGVIYFLKRFRLWCLT